MKKDPRVTHSKILLELGLLASSVAVAVAVIGLPEAADHVDPLSRKVPTTASDTTPDLAQAESLENSTADGATWCRVPMPISVVGAGDWIVRGRVRKGTFGSFARAPLSLRVYSGAELSGEPLIDVSLRANEKGDFAWSWSAPSESVSIEVLPELEGHKVIAATRVVFPGDAAPDDLIAYAYQLDARILGRVIDEHGEPVMGARVLSHLSEDVTNADGAYSLQMDSTYSSSTLYAVANGFAQGVMAVGALRAGDVLAGDLVLRSDYAVEGRVIDAQGEPIAGATVCTSPRDRDETVTDNEGRFRLGQLDPAKERTRVSAVMEGYVTASVRVGLEDAASPVEFVLRRGSRVAGRVVNNSGQPVSGATVSVGSFPHTLPVGSTRTDAGGSFSIDVVSPDSQYVWAQYKGFAAARKRLQLPEEGAEVSGIALMLGSGYHVAGVVLDETGEPLVGAHITPGPLGGRFGGPSFVGPGTTSNAEGRFELDELRVNSVELRVSAEGCCQLKEIVAAGDDHITLRPKRAGQLAGRVVDGQTGRPVSSFVVRFVPPVDARSERALTSYGAEWSQSGMSFVGTDGFWTSGTEALEIDAFTGIEVSAPGYAVGHIAHAVVLRDPAPDELLIELVSGAQLSGFILDAATGAPLPGARVRRFTDGDPFTTQRYLPDPECVAQSDASGRFTMERVPSGAMYLFVDGTALPLAVDGPFDVPPGASSVERSVELSMGGRLTGHLRNGEGEALMGETVSLIALDIREKEQSFEVTTDANGAFSFERLVQGHYHLSRVLTQAGTTVGYDLLRLVEIEKDQTLEQDLRPKGKATLRGTLVFEGELPDDLVVMLRPKQEPSAWAQNMRAAIVEDREFSATHLEAGEWTVQVLLHADGQMIHGGAKVELPSEGTVSVTVPLSKLQR